VEGFSAVLNSALRVRSVPIEVLAAGDHPERLVSWPEALAETGFRVTTTGLRWEHVSAALHQRRPAAFVLDLTDATRAGLDMAEQIPFRDEFSGLPVLFVFPESARLQSGPGGARYLSPESSGPLAELLMECREFVFAPVSAFELAVRLARLVQRPEAPAHKGPDSGVLSIDEAGRRVTAAGTAVSLRKKEYDLLLFLARNAGTVFTREALLRWVWGPGFAGDARTVDVHVRRLRSKLGEPAGSLIETVRRVGYRLAGGGSRNEPSAK
jgi:DNA-binding response OmpR family regulator